MRPQTIHFLAAAMLLLGTASSHAEEPAKLSAGLQQAREAAEKGDFTKAVKLLQTEAEKGSADAAIGLADFYLLGKGVKPSAVEAVNWLSKAADAGSAQAQLRLATLLLQGAEGVPKDADRAQFLLNAAADSGQPDAIQIQGKLEENLAQAANATPERTKHFIEARKLYAKAAELKQTDAMVALARFWDEGLGGETANHEKATDLLRKSADAGNAVAMNEIGVRMQKGIGGPKDLVGALGYFLSAAERGLPAAMTNLGAAYEAGNGVPQSFDNAGGWYARAAKMNFGPAQLLLGLLFEEGKGTKPNPASAYVNYFRAAAGGVNAAVPKRDTLKLKLTPAQLKEAEELLK